MTNQPTFDVLIDGTPFPLLDELPTGNVGTAHKLFADACEYVHFEGETSLATTVELVLTVAPGVGHLVRRSWTFQGQLFRFVWDGGAYFTVYGGELSGNERADLPAHAFADERDAGKSDPGVFAFFCAAYEAASLRIEA